MTWQEVIAITVVLLGLGAGAFLVAQRPSFWIEFGSRMAKALLPLAWHYVSTRMPPEEEAAWRQAERWGAGALHERLCSAYLSRLSVLLSDRFPSQAACSDRLHSPGG